MSVITTILVYVIIPAAVIGTVATIVFAGSDKAKPSRRYRPGRPYEFAPMWFLASPGRTVAALDHGHATPAIERGLVIEDSSGAPVRPGPTGGASDKW
ncbi:aa3-type cytochrome oxidase subunit CtaJ [Actinoplanes sp. HUAS TT8]|uniref:aa3-type cytochrome oxidase subunit CtaJ n=1 Tax=Actinoplanes sp. HUAS TT8 TaxID=3447453 RepID=UPI003F523EAD